MALTSQKNFNLLVSILSNHPLIKVNKELLLEQLRNEIFEMDRNKEKYNNSLLSMNKKIIFNMTKYNPLTTVKIKQREKLSNFDIRLKEHKEEFNNFNHTKPKEIDFRDKIEELPINSLDETLRKREEYLKNILKTNKKKINESLFNKKIKTGEFINHKINNEKIKPKNIMNPNNLIDLNKKTQHIILQNQQIIMGNQKSILRKLDFLINK